MESLSSLGSVGVKDFQSALIAAPWYPGPKGPKYPNMGVYIVSILGIMVMVSGVYSVFGYLHP